MKRRCRLARLVTQDFPLKLEVSLKSMIYIFFLRKKMAPGFMICREVANTVSQMGNINAASEQLNQAPVFWG